MANYPTSVPSFTTKSAAQTIASAHMNSVQDEVVAIGTGLLQGTAPLTSSNTSVMALKVRGSTSAILAAGNTNDLAIGADAFVLKLTGNAAGSTLTGISVAGGNAGGFLFLTNASANNVVLKNGSGSISSNQMGLPNSADMTLNAADGTMLVYDGAFWRAALI